MPHTLSRREFTRLTVAPLMLPVAPLGAQMAPRDAATVRGVKLGAITGVYGPFTPAAGQDVVDVVIARTIEAGIGHVELVNTLFEPRVVGGATRVKDAATGQLVVTLFGLVHGTRAAGECVVDAACLQAAERMGGSDLGNQNVQILVEAAVMGEDSGAPRVIAVNSW
jgi:hypothetical protein